MAVRPDVDAVQDEQALSVLLEEDAVASDRSVLDVPGRLDIGRQVVVHRVRFVHRQRALGIAEAGRIPAAASVDEQEQLAGVGIGGRSAAREGPRDDDAKARHRCQPEEISTFHWPAPAHW